MAEAMYVFVHRRRGSEEVAYRCLVLPASEHQARHGEQEYSERSRWTYRPARASDECGNVPMMAPDGGLTGGHATARRGLGPR